MVKIAPTENSKKNEVPKNAEPKSAHQVCRENQPRFEHFTAVWGVEIDQCVQDVLGSRVAHDFRAFGGHLASCCLHEFREAVGQREDALGLAKPDRFPGYQFPTDPES